MQDWFSNGIATDIYGVMTNPTRVGKEACCLEKRTVSVSSPFQQLGLQALLQQSHDKAATLPAQEASL